MSTRAWCAIAASIVVASCGGQSGSIGAILGKNHSTGRVTVRQVPGDMESARAGLLPGDEILLIEGRDVRRMTAEEVHDALVGPIGSEVDVTVLRGEEILRISVRRGPLK